jgi:hypothetical protein
MGGAPLTIDEEETRWFTVRLADDGSLDRQTALRVLQLCRPLGERVEVAYPSNLDTFRRDARGRWQGRNLNSNALVPVEPGTGKLRLEGALEKAALLVGADAGGAYVLTAKVRAEGGTGGAGLTFGYADNDNHYTLRFGPPGEARLVRREAGVDAILDTSDLEVDWNSGWVPGVDYVCRVDVIHTSGGNQITARLDGTQILSATDATGLPGGGFGVWKAAGTDAVECRYFERLALPHETDELEPE